MKKLLRKKGKQSMALLLSLAMIITVMLPLGVFADPPEPTDDISFAVSVAQDSTHNIYTLNDVEVDLDGGVKSINITYPSALTMTYGAVNTTTIWELTRSPGSDTFIVRGTAAVSNADIETIINGLIFKSPIGSPIPNDSKIKIEVNSEKTSTYVDGDGLEHHYIYVPTKLAWTEAFKAARLMEWEDTGVHGYLATITSQVEQDKIYNSIAKKGGWLGGTRLVLSNGTKIGNTTLSEDLSYDSNGDFSYGSGRRNVAWQTTLTNVTDASEWYWATGPEAGTVFWSKATYNYLTSPLPADDAEGYAERGLTANYHFFNNRTNPAATPVLSDSTAEPNNAFSESTSGTTDKPGAYSGPEGLKETCLTFAFHHDGLWNDLGNWAGCNGALEGYYVEFSFESTQEIIESLSNVHAESIPQPITVKYENISGTSIYESTVAPVENIGNSYTALKLAVGNVPAEYKPNPASVKIGTATPVPYTTDIVTAFSENAQTITYIYAVLTASDLIANNFTVELGDISGLYDISDNPDVDEFSNVAGATSSSTIDNVSVVGNPNPNNIAVGTYEVTFTDILLGEETVLMTVVPNGDKGGSGIDPDEDGHNGTGISAHDFNVKLADYSTDDEDILDSAGTYAWYWEDDDPNRGDYDLEDVTIDTSNLPAEPGTVGSYKVTFTTKVEDGAATVSVWMTVYEDEPIIVKDDDYYSAISAHSVKIAKSDVDGSEDLVALTGATAWKWIETDGDSTVATPVTTSSTIAKTVGVYPITLTIAQNGSYPAASIKVWAFVYDDSKYDDVTVDWPDPLDTDSEGAVIFAHDFKKTLAQATTMVSGTLNTELINAAEASGYTWLQSASSTITTTATATVSANGGFIAAAGTYTPITFGLTGSLITKSVTGIVSDITAEKFTVELDDVTDLYSGNTPDLAKFIARAKATSTGTINSVSVVGNPNSSTIVVGTYTVTFTDTLLGEETTLMTIIDNGYKGGTTEGVDGKGTTVEAHDYTVSVSNTQTSAAAIIAAAGAKAWNFDSTTAKISFAGTLVPNVSDIPKTPGTYYVTFIATSNDSDYDTATVIIKVTVVADVTYTVTYHSNGHTAGATPSATIHITGTNATILTKGTLVRDSYTFSGWSKNNAADAVHYKSGDTITAITANVDLYAVWTKNDTPPIVIPPTVTPPTVTPPTVTPPVVTPPAVTLPVATPPAVTPSVVTPPVVSPPAATSPVVKTPAIVEDEDEPVDATTPTDVIPGEITPDDPSPNDNKPSNDDTSVVNPSPTFNLFGNDVPLFGKTGVPSWALLNLLLAVVGALVAAFVIISATLRRRRDSALSEFYGDDVKEKSRTRKPLLALGVVVAIVGIVLFVITEDMSAQMVLMDIWTIVQVAILAATVVLGKLASRKQKDDEAIERV